MARTKILRRMARHPFEKTLKKPLKVSAKPALGGVEGLNELRRGTGEGVPAAESVAGAGNHQQLVRAAGHLRQPPALLDGHALVLPKAPARNILDASPHILTPLINTVQKVAIAAKTGFNADGMTVAQFSEHAGGQIVFHMHVHVMPRYTGVDLRPAGIMADAAVLERHAAQLRAAIG